MKRRVFLVALGAVLAFAGSSYGAVVDYEDLSLSSESHWNGSDGSGGFTSNQAFHNNNYDSGWGSWDGFAYSNKTDTGSKGPSGQYTAYSNGGAGGDVTDPPNSANYGVGYVGYSGPPTVTLPESTLSEAYYTNNAYAYWSMMEGDSFAKKFGGDTGDDPDWFMLTITGKNAGTVTDTVDFYLADFRYQDNTQDYIVDDWTWLDLTPLGTVTSLEFALSSSDVGGWGMNTPAYFAMDDLEYNAVPVPASVLLLGSGLLGLFGIRRRKNG